MREEVVADFCRRYDWSKSPEGLIVHLCQDLLGQTESRAPVDVRRLASFRGARVEEAEQAPAGLLHWDGNRLVISVRSSDSEERRRFTVCHEICHTFFPGFREGRTRTDSEVERFDQVDPEEYLCDLGASELLIPRRDFLPLLPPTFTLDDILELAPRFGASLEATAIRCVTLSRSPVAVLVLERSPTPTRLPVVRRAASNGLPHVSLGAAIPAEIPLGQALDRNRIRYLGEAGVIPGITAVSARSIPYPRAGEEVERAIVLIRPAGNVVQDTRSPNSLDSPPML